MDGGGDATPDPHGVVMEGLWEGMGVWGVVMGGHGKVMGMGFWWIIGKRKTEEEEEEVQE